MKLVTTSFRYAIACAMAIAIAVPAGGSAAPASDAQLREIKVAIIAVDATGQVMYARHRGFFRQQGIEADLTVLADGTLTVPALLSGQAQFAAIPVAVLAQLKANNAPVRAVAGGAVYEPGVPTTGLYVAPTSRIRRARDLVGRRVGVDFRNSIAHIGLLRWLQRGGVSRDDVSVSTLPFPQMLGPLLRGDLDAAWFPEPFATQAMRRGARRIALPFDAVCSQDCLLTAYIARRDVDPDLAARFRNAVQAAAVWANRPRNRTASARVLARYAQINPAVLGRMARLAYATRLRPRMGQPWIDLYAEYGLIPDTMKAEDLVR